MFHRLDKVGQRFSSSWNVSFNNLFLLAVIYSTSQSRMSSSYTHATAEIISALPRSANVKSQSDWARHPPRAIITRLKRTTEEIELTFTLAETDGNHARIIAYEIYACEHSRKTSSTHQWIFLDKVNPMTLPISIKLTQKQTDECFYFAVRAVDEHRRTGLFSIPRTW